MDNDQIFWLRIWQTISALTAVGILMMGGCTCYETAKVAEMVAGGADPIAARCALGWTGSVSGPLLCATNRPSH